MSVPVIRFTARNPSQLDFFATLRNRVDNYFKENNLSKNCNSKMIVKSFVFVLVGSLEILRQKKMPMKKREVVLLFCYA